MAARACRRTPPPRLDTAPACTAEIDLKVGGHYRIAFSSPDGERHEVSGVDLQAIAVTTFDGRSL